jgi:hypothetical protein
MIKARAWGGLVRNFSNSMLTWLPTTSNHRQYSAYYLVDQLPDRSLQLGKEQRGLSNGQRD